MENGALQQRGNGERRVAKRAKIVKYGVRPGQMDAFLAALRDHVAKTRASETGCLQFDILMPDDGAGDVRLYEVYADDRALAIHDDSEQLAAWRAVSDALLDERSITVCTIAP